MIHRLGFRVKTMFRISARQSTQEELAGWICASPWILGFILFTVGPMLFSLIMSFMRYDVYSPPTWVGLGNFARIFTVDNLVPLSLKVTTVYGLMSVPLHLIFGFLLAVLLNQKVILLSVWRTIFYIPSVVSGVSVMILWILLLSPRYGLMNALLAYVGIQGPNWLGAPEWALFSLVLMSLWGVGSSMLIYLAGLQGIPSELYDAAQVDGANGLQRFAAVTIPMMSPVIFFNLIMGIIGSLQSFNTAFVMTSGGPAWSTYFYMLHLYTTAFEELRMGYASALAWILFMYIIILTLLVFRFSKAFVYYEAAVAKGK